jgi:aryl-alcohol dehydrogenase-like predicted oxidoreductase
MEPSFADRARLPVSALALGTAALGMAYGIHAGGDPAAGEPPPSEAEAVALLRQAVESGIQVIDTARAYGRSETLVGQAFRGRRETVFIATKVHCLDASGAPLTGAALRRQLDDSLRASLDALQTDYLDLLMIHSAPPELLERGEVYGLLADLKARGIIRLTGASTYGTLAPRLAINGGLDVLQIAYNVLDRRLEAEILPLARRQGVGVMARSVYLKGALTARGDDLPAHLDELRQRSRRFRAIAADYGVEPAAVALRFVLSQDTITTALIGVRTAAELQLALAAAAQGRLPPDLLAALDDLRTDDVLLIDPSRWGIP